MNLARHALCLTAALFAADASAAELSADEILKRTDDARTPAAFTAKMEMKSIKEGKSRGFVFAILAKLGSGIRLEFTDPVRERGKKLLRKEDNVWFMGPDLSKPLRLSKKDSFMGSSFSNSDMLEARYVGDYTPKLMGKSEIGGEPMYELELTATAPSVTYAKILLTVRKANFVIARAKYFAASGDLLKVLVVPETKDLAGRVRASRMVMVSPLTPKARDEVVIHEMKSKKDVDSQSFHPRTLLR